MNAINICSQLPSVVHSISIDQSDFRVAKILFSTNQNQCYFGLVNTVTGQILTRVILPEGTNALLQNDRIVEFKSTDKQKLQIMTFKNNFNEKELVQCFVTNSAVEDVLSKIKLEFPEDVKTAHFVLNQFSPLSKKEFSSTRPAEFITVA